MDKFGLLKKFNVIVPKDYKHETQLSTFRVVHGAEFGHLYDPNITDANYALATRLIPGSKFCVKIFEISRHQSVTSE